MATAATLAVSIVARIQGLTKGLNRASGEVRKFGRGVQSSGSSFGGLLKGIGLVAGVTGIGRLINSSLDSLDSLSEVAAVTGFTANQLLAYRHAANLAGVGQEQFDTGLTKFAKSVGEAKLGTGGLVTTVDKLIPGFGAAIAATTTQDQALRLVAQAYASTDDAALRAIISTAAFGKSGARLGELLAGGAAGLTKATDALKRFGIAITPQDTANASAAKDAIDSLEFVLGQKLLVTVGKLAPYIAEVANKLLALASSSSFSSSALFSAFQAGAIGAAKLVDVFSLLKGVAYGFKSIVEGIAAVLFDMIEAARQRIIGVLNLLPGVNIDPKAGFIAELATAFSAEAGKSFSAAGEALEAFARGDAATATTKFFEGIEAKAKLAGAAAAGTGDAARRVHDEIERQAAIARARALAGRAARDKGGIEIRDFKRTVLGGVGGVSTQEVHSKQLDTLIEIQRKVLLATPGSSVPVAG